MKEQSGGQWWLGTALSKGGWAEKFNGRWKTLKMEWMRENTAQKGLVKIFVWQRGWWPPQIICRALGGFLAGGAWYKQGFIWEYCVKIYISASNSRSDCNELNEWGTSDVSGRRRNVGFLVCVIRTLGSWVSFNCHPKLLILPNNEDCEESYWFPSGQTIYSLVLISLMCIFIPCHRCDQAKAAFIGRFQVGFQLNMWLELQGVNGKNWLSHHTGSAQYAVSFENLHLSRSSYKASLCCNVRLHPKNKTGTERAFFSPCSTGES